MSIIPWISWIRAPRSLLIAIFLFSPIVLFSQDRAATEILLQLTVRARGDEIVLQIPSNVDYNYELRSLGTDEIVPILEALLDESVLPRVHAAAEDGFFTPGEIEDLGMGISFDTMTLEVAIDIPVELVGVQTITVSRDRVIPSFEPIAPARISLGIPFWADLTAAQFADDPAVWGVSLRARPGISAFSWTAESDLSAEWSATESIVAMERSRVTKTWTETGTRFQAGQFVPFSRSLQSSAELMAVSIDNLQADEDFSVTQALFTRPLVVDAPGTVDVVVNGRTVRSTPVVPGRYSIESVPVFAGINTVSVVYRRDDGTEEETELILPSTGGLVAHRRYRYSVAAGVVNDGLSPPGVTGFLQYGMKPSVTVGLLGDIFADGGQAGAEVTAAVPVGEVSGTTHLSWDKDAGVGWSVRGGYRLNILDRTTLPVIAVSTGYRSRSFVIPAAAGASSPSWEVTGSISQLLPAQVGATLSYAYRDYHDDIDPTSVVYASLSRRLSRGASARITGYLDTMAPEEEWGVSVMVTIQERNVSGFAVTDARNIESDLSVTASDSGERNISGTATIQDIALDAGTIGGTQLSGRLDSSLVDLSVRGGVTLSDAQTPASQEIRSTTGALRVGTGMYVAEKHIALARPIQDSWVMVRADDSLPVDTVFVTRGRRGGQPRSSGWWGPALVGPLRAGEPEALYVEVPGIPADYSLGSTEYLTLPSYRSGTVITIRSTNRLYIRGRLITSEGEPILLTGLSVTPVFISLDENDSVTGSNSFTDDAGFFEIYDVIPGRYDVILRDGSNRVFSIDVPSVPGPFLDLGDFSVPSKGEER